MEHSSEMETASSKQRRRVAQNNTFAQYLQRQSAVHVQPLDVLFDSYYAEEEANHQHPG